MEKVFFIDKPLIISYPTDATPVPIKPATLRNI